MTIYVDSDGKVHTANKYQTGLFQILSKLGIKSTPKTIMTTITSTFMPAGQYTVSANVSVNGNWVVVTSNTVTIPSPAPVPKKYKKSNQKPWHSRSEKKTWRDQSAKHSRNTGRRF